MTSESDAQGNFHGPGGQFITVEDHIDRILEERQNTYMAERTGDKKALELQAKEYERRLELLNNSFERSAADREDFVTKTGYKTDLAINAAEVKALALKLDDALGSAANAVNLRFDQLDKDIVTEIKAVTASIVPLVSFKDKSAWMGPLLVIVGGIVGSAITKVLIG